MNKNILSLFIVCLLVDQLHSSEDTEVLGENLNCEVEYENRCVKCQYSSHFLTIENKCGTTCSTGSFFPVQMRNNNVAKCIKHCNRFISHCKKCNNLYWCTECEQGKILFEGFCVDKCQDGFHLQNQAGIISCLICHKSCKTSKNNQITGCLSCHGFWNELINGKCQKITRCSDDGGKMIIKSVGNIQQADCSSSCPSGITNDGICFDECILPYYTDSNGICLKCNEFVNQDGTCIWNSQIYLHLKISNIEVKKCHESCY